MYIIGYENGCKTFQSLRKRPQNTSIPAEKTQKALPARECLSFADNSLQKLLNDLVDELAIRTSLYLGHERPHHFP